MRTILAFVIGLTTVSAFAQIPGADAVGNCTPDFISAYQNVASEASTVAAYVKANETPPNLKVADDACTDFSTRFPELTCKDSISGKNVFSKDLAGVCSIIHQLYTTYGGNRPGNVPAVIDDSTAVGKIPVVGLNLQTLNAPELQRAIDGNRQSFVIEGKVYAFAESILVPARIRCAIYKVPNGTLFSVAPGEALKIEKMAEDMIAGARYTRMKLTGKDFTIDCTSRTGVPLSLGDLKAAFASLIDITYTKQ